MYSELLQLLAMVVVFGVAFLAWLKVVYLPRRTLERWEGERVAARDESRETNRRP